MDNMSNETLRHSLKAGLELLSAAHRDKFSRMYSNGNHYNSIDEVVDNMPSHKLDWALIEVYNSYEE